MFAFPVDWFDSLLSKELVGPDILDKLADALVFKQPTNFFPALFSDDALRGEEMEEKSLSPVSGTEGIRLTAPVSVVICFAPLSSILRWSVFKDQVT